MSPSTTPHSQGREVTGELPHRPDVVAVGYERSHHLPLRRKIFVGK